MKNRQHFVRGVALFLAALMLFSLLFAAIGSMMASAVSSSDLDKLEQEKESIRNDKIEAGNKAASLRKEKAAWMEQKAALDERNRLAQEEIMNILEQIEVYNKMIEEKQEEANVANLAAEQQLAVYKKRLRSMEENGQYNLYLGILFGASSFEELLSRVDMISEIMENDKRVEQAYKDTRDEALRLKAEYEELNEKLDAKRVELEEEVKKLEKEIAEADAIIAEIQKDIDEYMKIYNAALQREYAVQNSINKIVAELKAAEEAAKQPQPPQQPSGGNEGGGDNSGASNGGSNSGDNSGGNSGGSTTAPPNTSTVTGSYVWPLPSSRLITSLFGNRVHPVSGTVKFHKGVDINASVGAAVVAADGGTVISVANQPDGYGLYVVIYHSGGRRTLYAHMSGTAVTTGQVVTQGQTIGYAGSSGVSTGPHLHFEIAVDNNLHDPLSYFSGYTIWDKA